MKTAERILACTSKEETFTLNSTLKKAFWPAIVAVVAFMVLGAFTAPKASAGDVVAICGPEVINEGDTVIYVAQLDSAGGDSVEVDLDDITGDSDITSELRNDNEGEDDEEWIYAELDNPTDQLTETDSVDFEDEFTFDDDNDLDYVLDPDLVDVLEGIMDDFDTEFDFFDLFMEDCGTDSKGFIADVVASIIQCIDTSDCDSDWTEQNEAEDDDVFPFELGISPKELATIIAEMILDDHDLIFNCTDLHDEVEDFLIGEGVSENIASDIANDVAESGDGGDGADLCGDGEFFGDVNGFALIDVTCEEAGEFDLSFEVNQEDSEPSQITVQCVGDVDDAEIVAEPTTVEIVPARGSASASLVTLNLLDSNGDPSGNGTTVVWTTDRCRLSDDGISIPGKKDTWENMIADALEVFGDYNRNNAQTALDINVFVDGLNQTTRTTVEAEAFSLDDDAGDFDAGDVISAVILDCSATNTTPGIAKVMACIDVDGADICKSVNVTVVGPPVAPIVLTTDQTNVRCGERVQITATIKDAAGQNVSDHTLVEVATNAGGVLGGTGAIAGEAGLVSPVSSTVAETNNGVATFWLITSELHQGTYTVLVTTGGGGSVAGQLLGGLFSTPPVSGAVTVTCGGPTTTAPSAPSPAATVRAPSTGQGITPPSTGDAGLADASGSSWALFVIAGLTVFALAGVASFKVARR
jgi:hypothetical protein